MDGLRDIQERVHRGFEALLDGRYDDCIEALAPVVAYVATDQMLLALLVSLQRVGANDALSEFEGHARHVLKNDPASSLCIDALLGAISVDAALERSPDAVSRARIHFYLGTRLCSSGDLEAAAKHLRACVAGELSGFEADLARNELGRLESADVAEDAWINDVARLGELLRASLRAGHAQRASEAAQYLYSVIQVRRSITDVALVPALECLSNYLAGARQWRAAAVVFDYLARNQLAADPANEDVVLSLRNAAVCFQNAGAPSEARDRFEQALAVCHQIHSGGSLNEAVTLNLLGYLLVQQGQEAEAIHCHEQAAQICLAHGDVGEDEHAMAQWNLGRIYLQRSEWSRAIEAHSAHLALRRRASLESQDARIEVARAMNDLALAHQGAGDVAKAELLFRDAIAMFREAREEPVEDYARALFNLGHLRLSHGRAAEALESLKAAHVLATRSRYDDDDIPRFACALGHAYAEVGDVKAAGDIYRLVAAFARRGVGLDHVAPDLLTAANWLQDAGGFSDADSLYLYVIDGSQRRNTALFHRYYLAAIVGRIRLLMHTGRATEALQLTDDALRFATERGRSASREVGALRNARGEILRSRGSCDEAIEEYRAAAAIASQLPKSDDTEIFAATVLNNLGLALSQCRRFSEAEQCFRQALAVDRRLLGPTSPGVAIDLHNLAELLNATDRERDALALFEEALEIRRKAVGDHNPVACAWAYDVARGRASMGQVTSARELLELFMPVDEELVSEVFSMTTEGQRWSFLREVEHRYHLYLSLFCKEGAETFPAAVAYSRVLRRKGLLFETSFAQRDYSRADNHPDFQAALRPWLEDGDPTAQQEYATWTTLSSALNRAILQGPGSEGADEHKRQVAALQRARDEAEARLVKRVPGLKLEQTRSNATGSAVGARLPPSSALVEFVRTNSGHESVAIVDDRYLAFVVTGANEDDVTCVDLGTADRIHSIISEFLATISSARDEKPTDESSLRVRSAFEPILTLIGNAKRLFIAPDSELCLLPFSALPNAKGGVLHDDHEVIYLRSGRDLLSFGEERPSASAPIVVASPAYNLAEEARDARQPTQEPSDVMRSSLSHRIERFSPLKHTRDEGTQIAAMLGVTAWIGAEALKASIKAAKNPIILHLATHGFFLSESASKRGVAERGGPTQNGRVLGPGIEDPLLRSGLALAGANVWLAGGSPPSAAEDGLLMAADVRALTLDATELVVLSACDTGIGAVRTGEGVLGLRWAFMLAGARTLVMTLWKIPDAQAKTLMVDFYQHVLSGKGVAEALRVAQLALRASHPEPFWWAGFICQGDPGPLVRPQQAPRD